MPNGGRPEATFFFPYCSEVNFYWSEDDYTATDTRKEQFRAWLSYGVYNEFRQTVLMLSMSHLFQGQPDSLKLFCTDINSWKVSLFAKDFQKHMLRPWDPASSPRKCSPPSAVSICKPCHICVPKRHSLKPLACDSLQVSNSLRYVVRE